MSGGNNSQTLNYSLEENTKRKAGRAGLGEPGSLDDGPKGSSNYTKYVNDVEDDDENITSIKKGRMYTAPKEILEEAKYAGDHETPMDQTGKKIADREDKYLQRKKQRMISPPRFDPFAKNDNNTKNDANTRKYVDVITEQKLENERVDVLRKVAKAKEEEKRTANDKKKEIKESKEEKAERKSASVSTNISTTSEWDKAAKSTSISNSKWDTPGRAIDSTPSRNRWDTGTSETPRLKFGETPTPGRWDSRTPGRFGETPGRFGETPGRFGETPTPGGRKSRWDDKTPVVTGGNMTPGAYAGFTPTPVSCIEFSLNFKSGVMGITTPGIHGVSAAATMTPGRIQTLKYEKEMDERNRPLTDEDLDQLLPSAGYEVITIA